MRSFVYRGEKLSGEVGEIFEPCKCFPVVLSV